MRLQRRVFKMRFLCANCAKTGRSAQDRTRGPQDPGPGGPAPRSPGPARPGGPAPAGPGAVGPLQRLQPPTLSRLLRLLSRSGRRTEAAPRRTDQRTNPGGTEQDHQNRTGPAPPQQFHQCSVITLSRTGSRPSGGPQEPNQEVHLIR